MARSRSARPSDIGELALALPETAEAVAWGDRPAYQVRGRSFVIYRDPRPDALGADGERLTDVVVISCGTPEDKAAFLASEPPWFATPYFDGYNAVLVRLSELGQVTRDELAEVVEDAWLARAPKRLAKEWLAARQV
ncbi:MAG: MmcQ/YjbR family DNA-binding protein [Actinomycetales bacterium]